MRVTRITPRAINKPLLIVGIERTMLSFLLLVSVGVGVKTYRLIGIALFFIGCIVAKRLSRKDPNIVKIAAQLWKLHPVYDPIKREPFEMRIE